MPVFAIEGAELDLPRNLALLDTNVLIAFACPDDDHHAEAKEFIEEQGEFVLGVAPPVVAEACSFIIGKRGRHDWCQQLLRYLLTPGTGILVLPAPHGTGDQAIRSYLSADLDWMSKNTLDYVDAFLMQMASTITGSCAYKPDLVIVTKDLKDFIICYQRGYAYRIHDFRSGETY